MNKNGIKKQTCNEWISLKGITLLLKIVNCSSVTFINTIHDYEVWVIIMSVNHE